MGERFNRWALSLALRRFLKGDQMGKFLALGGGYRTYLVGAYGALSGLAALLGISTPMTPALSHDGAIQLIVTSLIGIFLRKGVASK